MSRTRTFIAVEIAAAVRSRAAALIEVLTFEGDGVKWVVPENLHVTLQFLGDVAEDEVAGVCQAVGRAVADRSPFEISLKGAHAFPHIGRPRTLWLGVDAGAESLSRLQQAVQSAVRKLGFPPENRAFHAHLTLGRVRRPSPALQQMTERLRSQQDFSAGRSPVEQVVVFASYLDRHGPTYQALHRAPLSGPGG